MAWTPVQRNEQGAAQAESPASKPNAAHSRETHEEKVVVSGNAGRPASPPRTLAVSTNRAPRTTPVVAPSGDAEHADQEPERTQHARSLAREAMFQRWNEEPEDSEWTHAARESLGDIVERNQLGPEVIQDVSCKRSICRIELQFSKLADATGFADLAGDARAFDVLDLTPNLNSAPDSDMPATPQPGVRGVEPVRHYLVYLARPGHRISDVIHGGS